LDLYILHVGSICAVCRVYNPFIRVFKRFMKGFYTLDNLFLHLHSYEM